MLKHGSRVLLQGIGPRVTVMTPQVALKVLSLSPKSELTHAIIKKAYVAQTLQCHPDLHPDDPHAGDKFLQLSEALRIALRSLEMKKRMGGKGVTPSGSSEGGDNIDVHNPNDVMHSLTRAFVAYHYCRNREIQKRDASSRGIGTAFVADEEDHSSYDSFRSPSLEDVSDICKKEAVALRRVRLFCDDLPSVLCGSASTALFESVAFYNRRYVEPMSECVLRFSKNLPIIVRRVVKNRKRYIKNDVSRAMTGFGTGSRPRALEKIEDMVMKPLVLVGVLIFDTFKNVSPVTDDESHGKGQSSSTLQGVEAVKDIKVCDELKCVIYPEDSIGSITEKLGRWEAASFQRLRLEIAMTDILGLLSGMLDVPEGNNITVMHHLHMSSSEVENVSLILQQQLCTLCYHIDDAVSEQSEKEKIFDQSLAQHLEEKATLKGDSVCETQGPVSRSFFATANDSTDVLIAKCKFLAKKASPFLKGNIMLFWNEGSLDNAKDQAHNVAVMNQNQNASAGGGPEQANTRVSILGKYHVVRPAKSCIAEAIDFSISVHLPHDLFTFLLRLAAALEDVVTEADVSVRVLADLVRLRDIVAREEFIPENHVATESGPGGPSNTSVSTTQVGQTIHDEHVESEEKYRYRAAIHSFPRIHHIPTRKEFLFWSLLHANREYVALHASTMKPINLYYNCFPTNSQDGTHGRDGTNSSNPSELPTQGGWIGESDDLTCDEVLITKNDLASPEAFRVWLEDVVEQASLSKRCQDTLNDACVHYLFRDPTLPLAHYLSFISLFVKATAVKAVLERFMSDRSGPHVIVSDECDIREGGQILIPWHADPAMLLSLIEKDQDTERPLIQ